MIKTLIVKSLVRRIVTFVCGWLVLKKCMAQSQVGIVLDSATSEAFIGAALTIAATVHACYEKIKLGSNAPADATAQADKSPTPLVSPRNLSIIAALLFLPLCASAQTNTTPDQEQAQGQWKSGIMKFVDDFTTATNWNVHVEAMYFEALKKHFGARVGADYLISPHVYSTLSLCEANGTLYGMTGTFGVKGTWDVGNKGKMLISFAGKTGVGNTLSGLSFGSFTVPGKSENSGKLFAIVGSDVVFSFPKWKYAPDIFFGYEKWSNLDGNIYTGGLHLPLHVITDLL